MRIVLVGIMVFFSLSVNAQEIDSATVRKLNKYHFGGVYKSSVSLNVGGVTGFVGFSYDYFMSQHWRFEVGAGYYGFGFGFDYYPWPIKREMTRFRINIRNAMYSPFSVDVLAHSLGIGLTRFFKEKMNFGFDIGVSYSHQLNDWESYNWLLDEADSWAVLPSLNVKFGYRFSVKAWKRKRELEREFSD